LAKKLLQRSSITTDLHKIEAIVCVDFVILHIEVEIQSWQNQTKIMVKDRSRSDVVRMRRICNQLK